MFVEIGRDKDFILIKLDGEILQVYPVANSTFTIKKFPEEGQVRFYMHILGIDPSYYSHAGIDIYIKEGGTTSEIQVNGIVCDNDEVGFINKMITLLSN